MSVNITGTLQAIFILLVYCSTSAQAQTDTLWFDEEWKPASKMMSTYYRPQPKQEGNLYRIIDYYFNGKIQCEGLSATKDDIQWQGKVVWYYPDGDTMQISFYEAGRLHGSAKMYFNSKQFYSVRHFVNDTLHGTLLEYYPDASPSGIATYNKGKLDGTFTQYHKNGNIRYRGQYADGKPDSTWVEYFESGKLKSLLDYRSGKIEGRYQTYAEDDKQYNNIIISNGVRTSVKMYDNFYGTETIRTMKLENGIEHWAVHVDGILLMEYFYKDIFRTGTWTKYSEDGKKVIDRFTYTIDCRMDDEPLQHEFFGNNALSEKFNITELFGNQVPEGAEGYGEYMNAKGKMVKYKYAAGDDKLNQPITADRAFDPLTVERIMTIDHKAQNDDGFPVPEFTTGRLKVDSVTFAQYKTTFEGIALNILSHIDYVYNAPAWIKTAPAENEVMFYFNNTSPYDFRAKMGNTARMKYNGRLVHLKDLANCIYHMFPDKHFDYDYILEVLADAAKEPMREIILDEYIAEDYMAVEEAEEQVFTIVEQMPEFPGGEPELLKYLIANTVYPEEAMKNNIQGKVVVRFVVFRDGSVGKIEIARSVHPLLDAEAYRVIASFPKWKPGRQQGKAVNTAFLIPVVFKLQ